MTESLQQQAETWWLALEAGREDAALQARFDAWLAADDRHRLAYLDILLTTNAMDAGLQGLSEPLVESETQRPPLSAAAGQTYWHSAKPWLAGMALSSALVLGLLSLPLLQPAWESRGANWRTAAGQSETRTLDDGSQVVLGPDSAVRIQLTEQGRELELLRGELDVQVGIDPRPFLVRHQEIEIRDIGTRFRVDSFGRGLRVSVHEGEVAVRTPETATEQRIVAGGQMEWSESGWAQVEGNLSSPETGVLVLDQASVSQALAHYERQSGQSVQWLGQPPSKRISAALPMRSAAEQDAALQQLLSSYGLSVRGKVMGTLWIGPSASASN